MPLVTLDDLLQEDALDLTMEAMGMTELYNQHLAAFDDHSGKREAGIHASEISKCYRQAVYTMRGQPKQPVNQADLSKAAHWKRVMDQGHYQHAMIQNHFKQLASKSKGRISFEDEVTIAPHLQPVAALWDIYSSCDGLFTFYREDGTPYLRLGLEIKTSKDEVFEKLKEPQAEHIEQVHVYMATLRIPLFWVLYFNKNSSAFTPSKPPWLVRWDKHLWKNLEERFESFHAHVEAGTLPEPMPGMQCSFCKYYNACKPPKKGTFLPKLKQTNAQPWRY